MLPPSTLSLFHHLVNRVLFIDLDGGELVVYPSPSYLITVLRGVCIELFCLLPILPPFIFFPLHFLPLTFVPYQTKGLSPVVVLFKFNLIIYVVSHNFIADY